MKESRPYRYQDAAERLKQRSRREGDCLVYTAGAPRHHGHRVMGYRGRWVMVHRIAYELAYGPIPDGLVVMHTCDNPPCIEPSHLKLGTIVDNNRDRDEKGRHRPLIGSQNGHAKLTEDQVAVIKTRLQQGESARSLAREYGVDKFPILRIRNGVGWRHVQPAPWPIDAQGGDSR